jgi:hypothetical protein
MSAGVGGPTRRRIVGRLAALLLMAALMLPLALPSQAVRADSGQRVIIFVSGILTDGDSSVSSFQPMATSLLGAVFAPSSFGYFSYRGEWSFDCDDALSDWCHPVYAADDTRMPVPHHYPTLNRMVQQIVDESPDAQIDMVGYSLGGVVILSWLGTPSGQGGASDESARHIRSVVALDSPLQGLSTSIDLRTLKQASVQTGMIFGDASRDLMAGSPTIRAVAKGVRRPSNGTYAVENSADPVVNGIMLTGADGLKDVAGLCSRYVGVVVPDEPNARLLDRTIDGITQTHGLVLSDPGSVAQVALYLAGQRGGCQV